MPGPPTATSLAPVALVTHILPGGASGGFRESQGVSGLGQRTLSEFQCPLRVPSPGTGWGGPLGADLSFWLLSPSVLISFKRKEEPRSNLTSRFFLSLDALNSPVGGRAALPILQMRKQAQTSKNWSQRVTKPPLGQFCLVPRPVCFPRQGPPGGGVVSLRSVPRGVGGRDLRSSPFCTALWSKGRKCACIFWVLSWLEGDCGLGTDAGPRAGHCGEGAVVHGWGGVNGPPGAGGCWSGVREDEWLRSCEALVSRGPG